MDKIKFSTMKKLYFVFVFLFALAITQSKAQCSANFSSSSVGDTVTFTDMSTAGFGSVVSWTWNFGDGNFSTTQNPVHIYNACGVYDVSLTIFTSAFCSNTFNSSITVNGSIAASYTYTVDTTTGGVNFQPQPLGFNLNYAWDFGDGTVDSTLSPNHTYPSGTYYVCLTVYDDSSICSDTYCDSVIVYVAPPSCTTTFSFTDNGNGNVTFSASPFNLGTTYMWDFGDGNTGGGGFTFNGYTSAGTYYVCLTAIDSSTMCTSSFCDTVILTPDPTACNVDFTYFDNNGQVNFVANSFSTSNSYSWDFGDGNTGSGAGASNTYAASGTYYVCLTTTDAFDGCTATYCDSVVVVITGIEENENDFQMNLFPNPANGQTSISYTLKTDEVVMLTATDVLGKTIILIENVHQVSGTHSIVWNTENYASGIYLLKLNIDNKCMTQKLVIAK